MDELIGMQAIELVYLKGNKFHEDIGQALYYGDVTGQQKLEYVSGLCAAHGVEV
ncbi:MAG: hypothetical protein ACKJSG_14225 [Lentisphaeria bacterium]